MVLKYILIVCMSCIIGLQDTDDRGDIFRQHKAQVSKELKKAFELKQSNGLKIIHHKFLSDKSEVYSIESDAKTKGHLILKEVRACALNGCTADSSLNQNIGSEYFSICVILDASNTILSIEVLDYFSDYGYEITSRRYLKQYQNKAICAFNTDSDLVDGISGATVSYNSLVQSLEEFCDTVTVLENSK